MGGPSGQTVTLAQRCLDNSADGRCNLLFEGDGVGSGRLIFEIWKDSQKVCESNPIDLNIQDVTALYDTWTVGDVTSPEITDANNNYSMWPSDHADKVSGTGTVSSTPGSDPTERDYIIFVHGWNMSPIDKTQFADTMYKRLWQLGYKGRFGAYRWPTFYTSSVEYNNFNGSEERAWNSAHQLANLVQTLSQSYNLNGKSKIRLFGHSMGNIVCSEALRNFTGEAPVHTYISGQAALVAHCWDKIGPAAMSAGWFDDTTPNVYKYYWQPTDLRNSPDSWKANDRPSYMDPGYMPASRYINYYNAGDWALKSWQDNQKLKPSSFYYYPPAGFPETMQFSKNSNHYLYCPEDRFEIFSWAAQAQSHATGAEPMTGGKFTEFVDLNQLFGFDDMHKGHSAEFRSSFNYRWSFWRRFLDDCGL